MEEPRYGDETEYSEQVHDEDELASGVAQMGLDDYTDSGISMGNSNQRPRAEYAGMDQSMASASSSGSEEIHVFEETCEHLLKDMTYKERKDLRLSLDTNDADGIKSLMRKLLSRNEYDDVWRASRGGCDPAMGLLDTLGKSELTTLAEFVKLAFRADPLKCGKLFRIKNQYPDQTNTRLDELRFTVFEKIASEISAKPLPVDEQNDPFWKSIASEAGLSMEKINALDIPSQASRNNSMTMIFLEIVNQRYPWKTMAWLAKGLLDAQRHRDITDRMCFDACKGIGCVVCTN